MLLEVKDLKTYFYTRRGVVKAVNGVSFTLDAGKTLGLVGSPAPASPSPRYPCCAWSRARRTHRGGQILLDGRRPGQEELQGDAPHPRGQGGHDPAGLDDVPEPVYSVGNQVGESIIAHQKVDRASVNARVIDMLRLVRIPAPERRVKQYPHEMSGGMRQRVSGAIALSCHPSLLVCDEPTTSSTSPSRRNT